MNISIIAMWVQAHTYLRQTLCVHQKHINNGARKDHECDIHWGTGVVILIGFLLLAVFLATSHAAGDRGFFGVTTFTYQCKYRNFNEPIQTIFYVHPLMFFLVFSFEFLYCIFFAFYFICACSQSGSICHLKSCNMYWINLS